MLQILGICKELLYKEWDGCNSLICQNGTISIKIFGQVNSAEVAEIAENMETIVFS